MGKKPHNPQKPTETRKHWLGLFVSYIIIIIISSSSSSIIVALLVVVVSWLLIFDIPVIQMSTFKKTKIFHCLI